MDENPFDKQPTAYERYLYELSEAHGGMLIGMHKRLQLMEERLNQMIQTQNATNKAVLDLPVPNSEKVQ